MTYTWPSGEKYDGEYKDCKRHGIGIMSNPDGSKYEGEWKEDNPWTGTRTNADGSKIEYKDGKEI